MLEQKPWISEKEHILISKETERNFAGYIYRITNKRTMKSYIGKTVKTPIFRWWQHLKTDRKFDQDSIADLVFEVLEIVTYNDVLESDRRYEDKDDKLAQREMFYITHFDTIHQGYNRMLEKSKLDMSRFDNDFQL